MIELHRCGDGIINDSNQQTFENYNTIYEACDPGTNLGSTADDVYRSASDQQNFTCSDTCTLEAAPICADSSPSVIPFPQALDSDDITFTCDTENNAGGNMVIFNGGVVQQTIALDAQ